MVMWHLPSTFPSSPYVDQILLCREDASPSLRHKARFPRTKNSVYSYINEGVSNVQAGAVDDEEP